MIDPDLVLSAVVSAFRSIPLLVAEMADDPLNIYGHSYGYGSEQSLAPAITSMTSPSILVAYLDLIGGQFSGMTLWKHRLDIFIRPKNQAMGRVGGPSSTVPASPPHLFWLMMNQPVNAGPDNIRYTELIPGLHMLDAMPSLTHQTDENGADFFIGHMVFPEKGDA